MSDTTDDPRQILTPDGSLREAATVPDLSDDQLRQLYADIVLARRFDERAVSFQRRGEMGTFASMYGHEGAQVASVHAIADTDWLFHSYREHGATIAHGLPPRKILEYHMGHERGNVIPDDVAVYPICGTVAGQIPHATGTAWAMALQGDDRVALCHFGDGATSEGDFHEGLNFAGVFDVPAVFFCNNNQWAISTPFDRQTAAATIAQKADAYGFEGVLVDGMDPLAVYEATRAAAERARAGGGPTLIEARLYRLGAHNTADDPSNYRDETGAEDWADRDPLDRLEAFLRRTDRLDDARESRIQSAAEDRVDETFDAVSSLEPPDPEEMFAAPFATMPPRLKEQAAELAELRRRHDDEALVQDER